MMSARPEPDALISGHPAAGVGAELSMPPGKGAVKEREPTFRASNLGANRAPISEPAGTRELLRVSLPSCDAARNQRLSLLAAFLQAVA
jgi:hypothetical protein